VLAGLAFRTGLGAFPLPEKAQASTASTARPAHKVITRRRQ
jgi:hypothetical protein